MAPSVLISDAGIAVPTPSRRFSSRATPSRGGPRGHLPRPRLPGAGFIVGEPRGDGRVAELRAQRLHDM
jgi:hypothetical protein